MSESIHEDNYKSKARASPPAGRQARRKLTESESNPL